MRVVEKCSCGAKIEIVDDVRMFGTPRDSAFDLNLRIKQRVEDWRENHNHDKKMKKS